MKKINKFMQKLQEKKGDFVMDHAMVIIIVLVLGAITLTVMSGYIENDFFDIIKKKINEMFD